MVAVADQEASDWGVHVWTPQSARAVLYTPPSTPWWERSGGRRRWWWYRHTAQALAAQGMSGAAECAFADAALAACLTQAECRRWCRWSLRRLPRPDRDSPYNRVSVELWLAGWTGQLLANTWVGAAQLIAERWPRNRRREMALRLLARAAYESTWWPEAGEVDAVYRWLSDPARPTSTLRALCRVSRACLRAILCARPCGDICRAIRRFEALPREGLAAFGAPSRMWLTGVPADWLPGEGDYPDVRAAATEAVTQAIARYEERGTRIPDDPSWYTLAIQFAQGAFRRAYRDGLLAAALSLSAEGTLAGLSWADTQRAVEVRASELVWDQYTGRGIWAIDEVYAWMASEMDLDWALRRRPSGEARTTPCYEDMGPRELEMD